MINRNRRVAKKLCDDGGSPDRGGWREHSRSARVLGNERMEEKVVDADECGLTVQTVHVCTIYGAAVSIKRL